MRILGLDPGTARLGWGVIDTGATHRADKATCLAYGCIETDKSLSDSARLVVLADELEQVFETFKPELVSIEKLFFSKNQTTAMTVSQARGLLLYLTERRGIGIVEYTPQVIKNSLTGYGKADKKQMQHMVQLLLRLQEIPKPDDAADALAIAVTAAQHQRG